MALEKKRLKKNEQAHRKIVIKQMLLLLTIKVKNGKIYNRKENKVWKRKTFVEIMQS